MPATAESSAVSSTDAKPATAETAQMVVDEAEQKKLATAGTEPAAPPSTSYEAFGPLSAWLGTPALSSSVPYDAVHLQIMKNLQMEFFKLKDAEHQLSCWCNIEASESKAGARHVAKNKLETLRQQLAGAVQKHHEVAMEAKVCKEALELE
eukprot:4268361-Karenia_brevis.AAC.1